MAGSPSLNGGGAAAAVSPYWYQKLGSNRPRSFLSKFLVPDKSATRIHGRLAQLLVQDSGTSNLEGELGSCAIGLRYKISCYYMIQVCTRNYINR